MFMCSWKDNTNELSSLFDTKKWSNLREKRYHKKKKKTVIWKTMLLKM